MGRMGTSVGYGEERPFYVCTEHSRPVGPLHGFLYFAEESVYMLKRVRCVRRTVGGGTHRREMICNVIRPAGLQHVRSETSVYMSVNESRREYGAFCVDGIVSIIGRIQFFYKAAFISDCGERGEDLAVEDPCILDN